MACASHHTFAVFDMVAFGERTDDDQLWLRKRMFEMLAAATGRAGISGNGYHLVDRADGVALLFDASVPKPVVAEGLLLGVQAELRAHNRRSRWPATMRLRMSLHAGDVTYDGTYDGTWVGAELNTACRLVDLPEVRVALQHFPGAQLVLCVSDHWFQTVVRHDPGLVDHRTYLPIMGEFKELRARAWLHVPDPFPPPWTGTGRWLPE
jgi:class 3 adenylate cyclase